jgi:hypothetical protein
MHSVSSFIKRFADIAPADKLPGMFLRYFVTFLLIALSLASGALLRIITTQINPFFYAKF